jgi:hypothetical protein
MIWLVAIALIALLVIYWYITIPAFVLIVILWNKDSILKKIENNKIENTLQNKKLTQTKASSIFGVNWKNVILKNDVDYFNHICEICKNHELQLKSNSFQSLNKQEFQNILLIFKISYKNLECNVLSKRSCSEKLKSELKTKYNLTSKNMTHLIDNFEEIKNQVYENYLHQKRLEEQRLEEQKKQREERLKSELLAKFDLTESQAKILFKRGWYKKLSLNSEKLFLQIQDLIIDIRFEPKFRKRIYLFLDKVLSLIDNLYQKQRRLAKELDYKFEEVFEWIVNPLQQKTFWEEYARFKEKSTKYKKYFARYEGEWKDEGFEYEDYVNEETRKQSWKSYEQFFEDDSSDSMTVSEAFKVLGLNKSSTTKQIKDRFRELVLKYHPDRNPGSENEELTRKIITAYEFIQSKVAHA